MKHIISTCLLALIGTSLSAEIRLSEVPRLAGRIQYSAAPGSGAGSMVGLDQVLPQHNIRVGASARDGVGLGFLLGFELTPDQINSLMMATKVELEFSILRTDLGGPSLPLTVALLDSRLENNPAHFVQFGSWNNAHQFKKVGQIERDPRVGPRKIDVTEVLANIPLPSTSAPMLYFAIYGPIEELKPANAGRHLLISAEGDTAPRLIVTD
jgi:hypothetical protein